MSDKINLQIYTTFFLLTYKAVLTVSEVVTWLFEEGNYLGHYFIEVYFHHIKGNFKTSPKVGNYANKNLLYWLTVDCVFNIIPLLSTFLTEPVCSGI